MNVQCSNATLILAAVILAAGVSVGGWFVSHGLINYGSYNDVVTVKGLATQEVEADLVLWPIKHAATGNNLPSVQAELEASSARIRQFLSSKGIGEADIAGQKLEVTDLLAQQYRTSDAENYRYIVAETILVRTDKIDDVDRAAADIGELLRQGITLSKDNNTPNAGNPEYIYTKLNDIKPDMIAAATKSARESAEQFAKDSGTKVGRIKDANQGVFQILPRDSENGYQERQERYKTVRVVATLKYYLK